MIEYTVGVDFMTKNECGKVIIIGSLLLLFNQGLFSFENQTITYSLIALLLGFYFLFVIKERGIKRILNRESLIFLGFSAVLMIYYIFNQQFYLLMLFKGMVCLALIYQFYLDCCTFSNLGRKIILGLILLDTFCIWMHTFYLLPSYPELSRGITGGWFTVMKNGEPFYCVALFSHCYAMPIASLYFAYTFIKRKKVIYLILFISSLFCVICGTFLISILALIATLSFGMLRILLEKSNRRILLFLALFIIVLGFYSIDILKYIADSNLFGYSISVRINEIILFLTTGEVVGGDLLSRLNVYSRAIYPIIENKFLPSTINNALFGAHSTLLDFASIFGFFSIVLYTLLYKTAKKSLNGVDPILRSSIILYLFIILFLNPTLLPQIFLYIYILVPLMNDTLFAETD